MIANRKSFALGCVLAAGFLLVLGVIFAPVFGNGMNGLEYADDVFNKLSKGSSYFIPKVVQGNRKVVGTRFAVVVKMPAPEQAERAAILLAGAGAEVDRRDATLSIAGDLGQLLGHILGDAEAGYRNDDAALAHRYGMAGKTVLATWWQVLRHTGKALASERKSAEADAVIAVMKKAIEPAHNYYGIEAENVASMAAIMIALLLFYVLYTIWWGSAIFFLFEGFGLMMRKAPARAAAPVLQALQKS